MGRVLTGTVVGATVTLASCRARAPSPFEVIDTCLGMWWEGFAVRPELLLRSPLPAAFERGMHVL